MWRSIYLHELPGDHNALPGSVLPGSVQGAPMLFPPGQQFLYQLTDEIDEIIGYSARLRIHRPVSHWDATQRIFLSGADIEFRLGGGGAILSDNSQLSDALLRVGAGAFTKIGTLRFPHRDYIDLRVDWHTSGQAKLFQNRKLVGYHNSVGSSVVISVPNITLGRIDESPGQGPIYSVSKVFVRVLKRSDSVGLLSALLPPHDAYSSDELERCRYLALRELLSVAEQLRPFMGAFHQHETVPWSSIDSPGSNPFSTASVNAHQFAIAAGSALIRILRTGDFSNTNAFIIPFEKFLQILHESLPIEFETLAQSILAREGLSDSCAEALLRDQKGQGEPLNQIIDLINRASKSVLTIAGVN